MPFNNQRLVLCCDDDQLIIEVFERAFADQDNFVLVSANTIRSAIELVNAAFWDLIFLDMQMESVSMAGIRILEAIREAEVNAESKGKPVKFAHVIIMSGHVKLDDFSKRANELDVFSFMQKPTQFTPDYIKRVMRKLRPLLPMV